MVHAGFVCSSSLSATEYSIIHAVMSPDTNRIEQVCHVLQSHMLEIEVRHPNFNPHHDLTLIGGLIGGLVVHALT